LCLKNRFRCTIEAMARTESGSEDSIEWLPVHRGDDFQAKCVKITEARVFVGGRGRNFVMLKIDTDEGV
jgi:hypothetical protein